MNNKLDSKNLYDLIIIHTENCNGYIINSTQSHLNKTIDVYHWKLPSSGNLQQQI